MPENNNNNEKEKQEKKDGNVFTVKGKVIEQLPNVMFKVKLENGAIIKCHVSGKMRMYNIRVLPGDEVKVEITPYDPKKGRIVYRYK